MLHAGIEAGLESNIDWNWNFSSFINWLCKSIFTSNVKIMQGTFLSTCILLIKAITVPRFLSLNSIEVVWYLGTPWHDMKKYRIKSRNKFVIFFSYFHSVRQEMKNQNGYENKVCTVHLYTVLSTYFHNCKPRLKNLLGCGLQYNIHTMHFDLQFTVLANRKTL